MKRNVVLFVCISIFLSLLNACEEALPLFNPAQDRLNFVITEYNATTPSTIRKTFVYDPEDVVCDTIYVPVNSMGFVRDYDRYFRIEQVELDTDSVYNAIPGIHYMGFDDSKISSMMFVPAGQVSGKIPIVAFRDRSMRDTVVVLHLRIAASEHFLPGDLERIEQTVEIGDQLMQPDNWMCFGIYGYEKHRFLIEHFNMNFDEDTFDLFREDLQWGRWLNSRAKNLLAEENAERLANGKGPLTERDGTVVTFP